MKQAVILVGGKGTRLGALAQDLPKPMLPVMGRAAFLDLLIDNVARHGLTDILLLAGHLGDKVAARYDGAVIRGATVRVIVEPAPAGTGGALTYAAKHLDDVFLMLNGDSFLDFNYLALAAALGPHDAGVLALREVPDGRRYGRVETNGRLISAFREKDESHQGAALISGGVYVLRRSVLDLIQKTPCSIEADVFPKLVADRRLAGHVTGGYFIDIGLPDTLTQARSELGPVIRRGAAFFDRDGTLNVDNGYTHDPDKLSWQPGAIEAIRRCNDAGRYVFVVTNQSGIARGYFTAAHMRAFHARMQDELRPHGAHVDQFYFSPFHADGSVERFTVDQHPDRKPSPGMLRRASVEWPVDISRSFMIGDRDDDVGAARAFGIPGFKVDAGEILATVEKALASPPLSARSDMMQPDLKSAAAQARAWLFDHALPLWWEKGFDRKTGAFFERLDANGEPVRLPRRVRVQARQTYVYCLAGDLGWTGPWREAAEAGVKVILERCLRPDGGTRHMLDADANPSDDRRDLYDLAFVIFALAHAGRALKRPELIAKAEEQVAWLETNWAHPNGGFREGDVTPCPPRRQNPHMHMFEAFLALHAATGKAEHLARASKIARLFETKLFDATHGALPEYFDDAWTPVPGDEGLICEPGHQFEWSWLLNRWRDAGGGDLRTQAERMRVHGEVYGVDAQGFAIDETYTDGRPRSTTSRLWPHTERIKAGIVRYEAIGDEQAATTVVAAFRALMAYCDMPKPGLWRDRRLADGSFKDEPSPASSLYHIALSLSELIRAAS